ncbi:tigger transposable element-derived protein 1-like [Homarus americanus]|uniref:tigger transposable element-derived protein 1-like n=1 Tax=Homarus americanus TaxID=6706 RepID=UPI001C47ABF7|nr:tigger transposable element-derived protein 1-like [Homarus americanus]
MKKREKDICDAVSASAPRSAKHVSQASIRPEECEDDWGGCISRHHGCKSFPSRVESNTRGAGIQARASWNMDETGLFWKKMPQRTFIAQDERRAPGFKAAKDRCTVLFCGNAAGHLIRPGFIYKSKKPRAFERRDMSRLPVFWMHNMKAWTTSELFLNWFYHCFLPEVERYLHQKGFEFKILLILDNAPGHPQSVEVLHEKVQVLFLPPNTTALNQPMDPGVIKTVKANYSKCVMARLHSALDHDQNLDVIQYLKSFNIANCVSVVAESFKDVKPETVNAY